MWVMNQNHPDFLNTRFLLAGFYCIHEKLSELFIDKT